MTKVDLKRELKHLYTAPVGEVAVVEVPPLQYLMIDGQGNPNTVPEYKEAVEALYALAYGLKFMLKRSESGVDYAVMPLEGLWWADDMAQFDASRKEDWKWTMLIAQPPEVTPELFTQALVDVKRKKRTPALGRLRLERYDEGRAAQIMHIGPYAAEGPTIEKLHAFIRAHGFEMRGKHHEIYLGDPNRSAPEKLRTIIRQPIAEG